MLKRSVKNLKMVLDEVYKITTDWSGLIYCDISMKLDYVNDTVDLSMPGYSVAVLKHF
jgi:hypothetical protein